MYVLKCLCTQPIENHASLDDQYFIAHQYRNKLCEIELARRAAVDAALAPEMPKELAERDRLEAKKEDLYVQLGKAKQDKHFGGDAELRIENLTKDIKDVKEELKKAYAEVAKARKRLFSLSLYGEKLKKARGNVRAARLDAIERIRKVIGKRRSALHRKLREVLDDDSMASAAHSEAITEAVAQILIAESAKSAVARKIYKADEDAKCKIIQARRGFGPKGKGLTSGTYLQIEKSGKQMRKGSPPKFRRYTGQGIVAVQNVLTWESILTGTNNFCRLTPHDHSRDKHLLWLRIGSEGKRKSPVWTKIPINLHRQPPLGACVKLAVVVRRPRPDKWHKSRDTHLHRQYNYHVCFTVDSSVPAKPNRSENGAVGVDVGYRWLDEGLRVAVAAGDDGERRDLVIPVDMFIRREKAEDLEGIRKKLFNATILRLSNWLKGREDLPEWLESHRATLHSWKSQDRLAAMVVHWRENRFEGDDEIYARVEGEWVNGEYRGWRKQEAHLKRYEAGLVRKFCRKRDHLYSEFVSQLAQKYGTLVIEELNLKALAAKPQMEEKDQTSVIVRKRMGWSAVGGLLNAIKASQAQVILCDPKYTTKDCHLCGGRCHWDQAAELMHTCEHCGECWDQDYNAAVNLLARGTMQPSV